MFRYQVSLGEKAMDGWQCARAHLLGSNCLFVDSWFEASSVEDVILDGTLHPARALGDTDLNGNEVSISFDTNYLLTMRQILARPPGFQLTEEELRAVSIVFLSGLCGAKIMPGFALLELSKRLGASYGGARRAAAAFEYLCAYCDFEDLLNCVCTGVVPEWRLPMSRSPEISEDQIFSMYQNVPYKAAVHSCICAAILEISYKDISQGEKLNKLIDIIERKGMLGFGSLLYFSVYFSESSANHGIRRRSLLKRVYSGVFDRVAEGVINAAQDCFFVSEYTRSIAAFHRRNNSRIFATEDQALQLVMRTIRDNLTSDDVATTSEVIRQLRRESLPREVTQAIDRLLPLGATGKGQAAPLRPAAGKFAENADARIEETWAELRDLVGTSA